jgi:3'(2'), 5'-bisphosphate nucleotidase
MSLRTSLARELEVASEIAVRAGRLARSYFGTDLAVERKEDDEPVTIVDRQVSDLVVAELAREFPGDAVVSEESPPLGAAGPQGRVWFVDPIDGTRDFIQGEPGFAVMIGLAQGGRPELGVVYQPVGDRLFLAAPGLGACVREPSGERELRCSTRERLSELRLVASRSRYGQRIEAIRRALGIEEVLRVGSVGVKAGLIALGEWDLYLNLSNDTKAWDTCAPEAVLRAAGGEMTDLAGAPLRYDAENLVHPRGILASNGRVHDPVVALLREWVGSTATAWR